MPDVQEVFRMATQKIQPDTGFVDRQLSRQRARTRNRKLGAVALAAVIGVAALVVVIRATDEGTGARLGGQLTESTGIPDDQSIPSLPSGSVDPGRYVFTSYDPDLDASHRVSIEVPRGYQGIEGWGALLIGTSQTSTSTMAIHDVYASACQWKGTRKTLSTTEELVTALATQEGLRVTAPTEITVDGFPGTYMERRVPAETQVADCDDGQFRVYHDGRGPSGGARYLVPGQLQLLWIVDVDGVPLVIDASLNPGMSTDVRSELVAMVESVQIEPREEG